MKGWQYLLSGIVLIALVIQLVPSELPSTEINNPGDLIESGIVSIEVAGLLRTSCYDCHSNETKFPWDCKRREGCPKRTQFLCMA
jgi:hypothetical protein